MNTFSQIASRIIKEQAMIIGPLAWDEARKVQGVNVVNEDDGTVEIQDGDTKVVIDHLVAQYERLFGRTSREVCREAVVNLIADLPKDQIPQSLQ